MKTPDGASGSIDNMHTAKCLESEQVNICDDQAVKALSAALNCLPTDVYDAVAYVGDRVCCIRSHVRKIVAPTARQRVGAKVCVLPPIRNDAEA